MEEHLERMLATFSETVATSIQAGGSPSDNGQLFEMLASAAEEASKTRGQDATGSSRLAAITRVHRRIPSGRNAPRTQHAGDIAKDLLTLSRQGDDGARCLFAYFTDDEMAGYLDNPDNGLHRLFDLPVRQEYLLTAEFLSNRPKSFTSRFGATAHDVHLTALISRNWSPGLHLRVWEVMPAAGERGSQQPADEPASAAKQPRSATPSTSASRPAAASFDLPADWHELVAMAAEVTLEFARNHGGTIRRFEPQEHYAKRDQVELNRYGHGSFCGFRVTGSMHQSGVYFIVVGDELVYVGECADFSQRFNAGYGQISPKNCYRGGQETNCRVNKLILEVVEAGSLPTLSFMPTADRFTLERSCIATYNPPWNRRM